MFDSMFNAEVVVYKPDTVDVRAAKTYVEVLDPDGKPSRLRGRIEKIQRRIVDSRGAEHSSDATFYYRRDTLPELQLDSAIRTRQGETYLVLNIASSHVPFSSAEYARADLAVTRQAVPEPAAPQDGQ